MCILTEILHRELAGIMFKIEHLSCIYEEIDFEHRVTLAGMFSNNLIDLSTAKRISKMMLNWTNDKSYWFHVDKSSAMEL